MRYYWEVKGGDENPTHTLFLQRYTHPRHIFPMLVGFVRLSIDQCHEEGQFHAWARNKAGSPDVNRRFTSLEDAQAWVKTAATLEGWE